MTEETEAKKLYVSPATHRRLKMFAAYAGKSMYNLVDQLINDALDRETLPDMRHVAADSDHITMPNE